MKKPLPDDEVHIWQCFTDDWRGADLGRLLLVLSPDERQRYERFHFEKDRTLYLLAHALTRTALSSYADIAPNEWNFCGNAYGKPEISTLLNTRICFNLTHTDGFVAVAVARDDVGLDAENMTRGFELDLAKRVFAGPEVEYLQSQSAERAQQVFFEIWTLKEAFIKAKGLGLSIELDSFWFEFGQSKVSIEFAKNFNESREHWEFHQFEPAPSVRMAVATRSRETASKVQILAGSELLQQIIL